MASINLNSVKCIRFQKFGDPKSVLHLDRVDLGEWDGKCTLVRWLASPINPSDHYIIRGEFGRRYKPKLPAIGGAEAVGIVEKIGYHNPMGIKVGDRVIRHKFPSTAHPMGGGLWTEFAFMPAEALLSIDPQIELVSAATLTINPATAYGLLKGIVPLGKGDCIIQNGANSAVGRIIIQLAKCFGFRTINLIRKERGETMVEELRSMGADWVFSYEEFADKIKGKADFPRCKLGLNCVGGESAYLVSKWLEPDGTMVSYGQISNEEPKFLEGVEEQFFAMASYLEKKSLEEVKKIYGELEMLILEGKLWPPAALFRPMEEFKEAVENSISHGTKQILLLSQSTE